MWLTQRVSIVNQHVNDADIYIGEYVGLLSISKRSFHYQALVYIMSL